MKELVLKYLPNIVRYILSFAGAWLVSQGFPEGAFSQESIAGLALFITAFISSIVGKYLAEDKVDVALSMPEGSTKEDLKKFRG